MVNRIEFSAEPTDTYLMNVQYVSSFIAQVAFGFRMICITITHQDH